MELAKIITELAERKPAALARAISIIENRRPGFEALLSAIHPHLGHAQRLGITGPPGAGKSTLTFQLAASYRRSGLTVAIVAVDPTSPFTGGALLGDRIRMEAVALDPGVYIRSMATRGSLGGLALATREVCDVLDAAGFDRVLIETVGVGQTELDVAGMADSTALVLVPESGDEVQTLKSGVMEIADVFVINKADRPGADKLRHEIEVTLGIRKGQALRGIRSHHGRSVGSVRAPGGRVAGTVAALEAPAGWEPPVILTTASTAEGIPAVVEAFDRHLKVLEQTGELLVRRRRRLAQRARQAISRGVDRWLWEETGAEATIEARLEDMLSGNLSPYQLADLVVAGLKNGERHDR